MSDLDEPDAYARARPAVARRLRALGLDVAFTRGVGDTLYTEDGRAVLDLAGGFGTTLFGHNHPALVAALRGALDEQRPFSSQMSWRRTVGELSDALGARIARDEGHAPLSLFYSSGAEAVEAAIAWALLDFERRAAAAGKPGVAPVLLAVEGGYHGRSAGAASLSARLGGELGARALRAEVRFLPRNDPSALTRLCDELCIDGFCRAASVLVEPVQGEGGVIVLAPAFLASLRAAADRHGFLVIADEIQCGLGRTGSFLASTGTGLAPDGILLGKALGGSLVKLSALAIREERFVDELPLLATGTFVDDDLSLRVGLAALRLIDDDEVPARCARRGARLRARLDELAARHPRVVRAVRGRGLMIGVEVGLATAAEDAPPLLRLLAEAGYLAAALAGHLLHAHGVRTAPALSALSVLRLQPSAYLDEDAPARIVHALEESLALLEQGRVAALLAHLTGEAPPAAAPMMRRLPTEGARADAQVAFLAPLAEAADLRHLEPALAGLSDAACERLLERAGPLLPPSCMARPRIVSATGRSVGVSLVAVPVSARQTMAALRAGQTERLVGTIRAAAQLGVAQDARVVGFGGHSSIVAQLHRNWGSAAAWVSGNALTAAAAATVALEGARRRGLPLRVGVVGAAGSIGALLVELLAPDVEELVLVGRARSAARLQAVAARVCGATPWRVATEMEALRACAVVVTASNAPEPILRAEHLHAPALVVDVAVPGDASLEHSAGITVLNGGAVKLPRGQTLGVPGLDLGDGHIHACLAETLLCGLGELYDTALTGSPSAARARRLLELCAEHGFVIDEAPRVVRWPPPHNAPPSP